MSLGESLRRHFGHTEFRSGQQQVIQALLDGRSALAVFPTGGGKSICYQLPAILLDGLTLVISPLIALMKDQVDALRSRNIAAARLDSTLSLQETASLYEDMLNGSLKLLYIAPERLLSESFIKRLQRANIALLAIDEAHCISEWGHNFRPEYLRLARLAKKLKIPRVLALTATATPGVVKDICREFHIADCVRTPFHRRNLYLQITPISAAQRLETLTEKLQRNRPFPAIVYVTLQETAEHVAAHLSRNHIRATAYHAGLGDKVRARTQEDFMRGHSEVIVATIAFGMGIDKADIRAVYHYNLPKTLENYQQEIGRAGRDGNVSHCEMLACREDLVVLQNFTLGDTPTEAAIRQLVDHLLRQGREFDISRYTLSRATDIRPLVLETILTYLEHKRLLEPLGAFYNTYQIAFNHPESRILAGHTPTRVKFLKTLFASGKRGSRWLTLDIAATADALGKSRERLLKALRWLEEANDITLKPSGIRHRFRLLPQAEKHRPREVATEMYALFLAREKRDIERLNNVLALAETPGCITRHLLHYFGEELVEDCGHCERCRDPLPAAAPLPCSPQREISAEDLAHIRNLIAEQHPALRSARQYARFLCGITSPATIRDRLTRHDAFGLLQSIPFDQVLEQLESMSLRY